MDIVIPEAAASIGCFFRYGIGYCHEMREGPLPLHAKDPIRVDLRLHGKFAAAHMKVVGLAAPVNG